MAQEEHTPDTDIIKFLSEPCALFDKDIRYIFVNDAYGDMVGLSSSELTG